MAHWSPFQINLLENTLKDYHSEVLSYFKDNDIVNLKNIQQYYDAVSENNIGAVAIFLKYGINP